MRRGGNRHRYRFVAIALLVTWPTSPALAQPAPVVELRATDRRRRAVVDNPGRRDQDDARAEQRRRDREARHRCRAQNVLVLEGVYDPRVIRTLDTSGTSAPTRRRSAARRRAGSSRTESTAAWDWPVAHPGAADAFTVDFSGARLDTSNQFARLNPEFPSALTGTYAAARARPKHRSRSAQHPRRPPRCRPHRRAAHPGRDGPVDARRRGVLGSRLCLRQPRRPDRRARPGARAGREQRAAGSQGTLAPIDVVEAQTQVSRFQQAVFSSSRR